MEWTVIINSWSVFATLLATSFATERNSSKTFPLIVSTYEVTKDSVVIDWTFKRGENWSLKMCELVYGPESDPEHLEVLSNFLPDSHTFKVTQLTFNVSYHFHMVCYSYSDVKLLSNKVYFTTGGSNPSQHQASSLPEQFASSGSYRGYYDRSISRSSMYSGAGDDDNYTRTVQSSSVILGAVCGIVGFLIINITVVMAVRRYSQRQLRRRRILEIEERDYDDFPYLRGFE